MPRVFEPATAEPPDAAATEAERRIAWLRLAAIPLIAAARTLPHPNPEKTGFFVAIGVVGAYAVVACLWVYSRPVTRRFALGATAADVAAITLLAVLSGGAFSEARLTYVLIPTAVAFRFRPSLTAVAGATTVVAYLAQAVVHPASRSEEHAERFIAVQAGYLLWLAVAAVLLSAVLERRTTRAAELADARRRLMADALNAEERERRTLAEGLHDQAIQNLLSARHDLDEAAEGAPSEALARADAAISATVDELREAVFELHPLVLEQAGLDTALRAVTQRAARQGGFQVRLDLSLKGRHPHDGLLLSAARELLANVVAHASARIVRIRLADHAGEVVLRVHDDGAGFDPRILPQRLAEGHIGLRSQRERIEAIGGRVEIRSAPGRGAEITIHVPGSSSA